MKELYYKILEFFMRQQLSREAFIAYYNRLPNSICVDWFRDGNFIIGKIKSDDNEFMTQAKDANELIEMVNDALITVYDIPSDYYEVIKNSRTYKPTAEEWKKLNDASIKKCSIGIKKNKEMLRIA